MILKKHSCILTAMALFICVVMMGTTSNAISLYDVSTNQPVYGVMTSDSSVYEHAYSSSPTVSNLTISSGSSIMIVGYSGNYYYVQYAKYGEAYGYIPVNKVTAYYSNTSCPGKILANTESDPLNVRAAATINSNTIGQIPHGLYAPAVTSQNINSFYNLVWGIVRGFSINTYAYYISY